MIRHTVTARPIALRRTARDMARITLVPPDVPVSEAGTMVRDGVRGETQAGATGETNIVVRETMAPCMA